MASLLLEKQLIACANIFDTHSLYRWEGVIQENAEAVMICKTVQACLPTAIDEIKKHHSYTLPCVLALPVSAGFEPFLQWVADETISPK